AAWLQAGAAVICRRSILVASGRPASLRLAWRRSTRTETGFLHVGAADSDYFEEENMLRPVAILIAALFSTVTSAAYAADQDTPGEQKEAMKKKYDSPTVEQGAPAAEGRGDPTGAAAGGAVQQGAPA